MVLDARVYRTAFLPALLALFVAAFALQDRPDPARGTLPTDVFDKARAFGTGAQPDPQSLQGLAAAFPDRTVASAGDDRLADFVQRSLAAPVEAGQRAPFTVTRTRTKSKRGDLVTVIATRPGQSTRQVVLLAHRDGRGLADLSGTAALLELARVLKMRDTNKTLVLVSTSGATTGFAAARAWAKTQSDAPIDGVIVLGDMAGTDVRKPWLVGWTGSPAAVPLGLERTLQVSVRRETQNDAGGPRAVGQWIRRALPISVSEQGAIGAAGVPAVLLSASGELGPAADAPVSADQLERYGRAALDAVGALDEAGRRTLQSEPRGIVTLRNVLPDWGARMVVGALLLPALLAALDALFRARRRRVPVQPWIVWLAISSLPLVIAWLWLRALGAIEIIEAPDGRVLPDLFPLETSGLVAMGSALLAGALVTGGARYVAGSGRRDAPAERDGRRRSAPALDGLAVTTGLWLAVLAAVAWVVNPYAAGLLLPAVHLWLFTAGAWRGWRAAVALVVGVIPLLAVAVYYASALDLGPLDLAWGAALAAASGSGVWSALLVAGVLAALAGAIRAVLARRRLEPETPGDSIRTRGPVSYAGPGSLGGTESALRR